MNTNIELLNKLTTNWCHVPSNKAWKISPSEQVCYNEKSGVLEIHLIKWAKASFDAAYRPYALCKVDDDKIKIKVENNLLIINDMVAVVYE